MHEGADLITRLRSRNGLYQQFPFCSGMYIWNAQVHPSFSFLFFKKAILEDGILAMCSVCKPRADTGLEDSSYHSVSWNFELSEQGRKARERWESFRRHSNQVREYMRTKILCKDSHTCYKSSMWNFWQPTNNEVFISNKTSLMGKSFYWISIGGWVSVAGCVRACSPFPTIKCQVCQCQNISHCNDI